MQATETKTKISFKLTIVLSILSLFVLPNAIWATEYTLDDVENAEIWQINQDINEKRAAIQELNRQVEVYKKNINAKQKELATLSNQVSTLNQSIAKINLEVQATELEMETLNLKIENTQLKIQAKEREIQDQKEVIAEVLRDLHVAQQKSSTLEILLLNDNFSDFISDLDRLESMQDSLTNEVKDLNQVKISLVSDQESLETEKTELDTLKGILDNKIGVLDSQKSVKYSLMQVTEGQESKFQQLLQQAKEEQEQANSDIVYLEKVAREKLNRQLKEEQITSEGLMWPVDSRRVTAYFHDPDYPYRYIFEHPAIDIGTPQGTPIVAADTGYVGKVKDGGQTGYSYILIVHADGLSTVYGHVNQISVENDQLVGKGQIIGYSGGLPGTRGAGPLSSGPHLHFELRMNGIPINPLNYLP